MIVGHSEGTAQEILEKITEYFTNSKFTNIDGDGFQYSVDKFNFDANSDSSSLELVKIGKEKPRKRFIYKLITSDK